MLKCIIKYVAVFLYIYYRLAILCFNHRDVVTGDIRS